MSITTETRTSIAKAIRRGLRTLERPEPLRLSEWADQNFYLVAESSYIQGRWETLPYQRAPMDCMSNDDIRSVSMRKSARVGYTKMIVAAIGYFAEHKRRNQVVFQPVDQDAEDFTKDEIDPMLRDVPAVQRVFPSYNTRSKYNTLSKKVFRGSTLDIRGGKAAKNYRRLSKDVAMFDELDGFDPDIEGEGDPVTLGDKRVEGATFPKSIRGSTPGITGLSLIAACEEEADERFRYFTPCPHCGHEQVLKWGGPEAAFGMKWDGEDPSTVFYLCENAGCGAAIQFEEYLEHGMPRGVWRSENSVWIDEHNYFRAANGDLIDTPAHVAFHIWTAIAAQVHWSKLVDEFLKAKRTPGKLKTFVTTTLGETWDEDEGERTDAEALLIRREHYGAQVPDGALVITVGIDTQDDRIELQYDGWGIGEERWTLGYERLFGDPSRPGLWDKLAEKLRRTFTRADGTVVQVALACQDHGGHFSDEVTAFSKRMGIRFLVPIQGANESNKPVATFPRKKNARGVYLTRVGTDTAKSLLYHRYKIEKHGAGYVHWPLIDEFDRTYFDQVTAEQRVRKFKKGVPTIEWDAKGRRNEAGDCSVYSLAAVRILQQHFGLVLTAPDAEQTAATPPPRARRRIARSRYMER